MSDFNNWLNNSANKMSDGSEWSVVIYDGGDRATRFYGRTYDGNGMWYQAQALNVETKPGNWLGSLWDWIKDIFSFIFGMLYAFYGILVPMATYSLLDWLEDGTIDDNLWVSDDETVAVDNNIKKTPVDIWIEPFYGRWAEYEKDYKQDAYYRHYSYIRVPLYPIIYGVKATRADGTPMPPSELSEKWNLEWSDYWGYNAPLWRANVPDHPWLMKVGGNKEGEGILFVEATSWFRDDLTSAIKIFCDPAETDYWSGDDAPSNIPNSEDIGGGESGTGNPDDPGDGGGGDDGGGDTGGGGSTVDPSKGDTSGNPYIPPGHAIIKGHKGAYVKAIQTMINDIMGLGIVVDGDFGNQTLDAVKQFQEWAGITVDGYVGNQTWGYLLWHWIQAKGDCNGMVYLGKTSWGYLTANSWNDRDYIGFNDYDPSTCSIDDPGTPQEPELPDPGDGGGDDGGVDPGDLDTPFSPSDCPSEPQVDPALFSKSERDRILELMWGIVADKANYDYHKALDNEEGMNDAINSAIPKYEEIENDYDSYYSCVLSNSGYSDAEAFTQDIEDWFALFDEAEEEEEEEEEEPEIEYALWSIKGIISGDEHFPLEEFVVFTPTGDAPDNPLYFNGTDESEWGWIEIESHWADELYLTDYRYWEIMDYWGGDGWIDGFPEDKPHEVYKVEADNWSEEVTVYFRPVGSSIGDPLKADLRVFFEEPIVITLDEYKNNTPITIDVTMDARFSSGDIVDYEFFIGDKESDANSNRVSSGTDSVVETTYTIYPQDDTLTVILDVYDSLGDYDYDMYEYDLDIVIEGIGDTDNLPENVARVNIVNNDVEFWWYEVYEGACKEINLELDASNTTGAITDYDFYVYDNNGNLLASRKSGSPNVIVPVEACVDKRYFKVKLVTIDVFGDTDTDWDSKTLNLVEKRPENDFELFAVNSICVEGQIKEDSQFYVKPHIRAEVYEADGATDKPNSESELFQGIDSIADIARATPIASVTERSNHIALKNDTNTTKEYIIAYSQTVGNPDVVGLKLFDYYYGFYPINVQVYLRDDEVVESERIRGRLDSRLVIYDINYPHFDPVFRTRSELGSLGWSVYDKYGGLIDQRAREISGKEMFTDITGQDRYILKIGGVLNPRTGKVELPRTFLKDLKFFETWYPDWESHHSAFKFYMDGQLVGEYPYEQDGFINVTVPVTKGIHEYEWVFERFNDENMTFDVVEIDWEELTNIICGDIPIIPHCDQGGGDEFIEALIKCLIDVWKRKPKACVVAKRIWLFT